jgi:hypothetical protein
MLKKRLSEKKYLLSKNGFYKEEQYKNYLIFK